MTMGTNCLGPYLLTELLLPVLHQTAHSALPGSIRITWASLLAIEVYSPEDGVAFDSDGAPVVYPHPWSNYG